MRRAGLTFMLWLFVALAILRLPGVVAGEFDSIASAAINVSGALFARWWRHDFPLTRVRRQLGAWEVERRFPNGAVGTACASTLRQAWRMRAKQGSRAAVRG